MAFKNDWIEDDKKRALFWATGKGLGLSDVEMRTALGLAPTKPGGRYKSTKEYEGSLDDALAALEEYAEAMQSKQAAREEAAEEALDEEKIEDQITEDFGEEAELTEPGCVLFSQALLTSKKGARWELNFTLRGKDFSGAFGQFVAAVEMIEKWQGEPLLSNRYDLSVIPPEGPASETSSPSPRDRPARQRGRVSRTHAGYTNVKSGALEAVEVRPNGDVWVHVEGAQYPLQDRRGLDAVAPFFAQSWPIDDLYVGYYEPPKDLPLTIVYGKNERGYWDLLEVQQ